MSFNAVILAGGKGTRLRPFTYVLPKPLLPVAERPILDVVLSCLARDGCAKVTIAVGHLGHLIELFCGSGSQWGLEIEYFREDEPLGTVGALAQLDLAASEPFVVMNGDVLCDVSFEQLVQSHTGSGADLTINTFNRTVRDELGILERDPSGDVIAYHEKPEHSYLVSTGIYVMSPGAVDLIPRGQYMDFPDLVKAMIAAERRVHSHLHDGYWLDLGRPDDFAMANEQFDTIRPLLGV